MKDHRQQSVLLLLLLLALVATVRAYYKPSFLKNGGAGPAAAKFPFHGKHPPQQPQHPTGTALPAASTSTTTEGSNSPPKKKLMGASKFVRQNPQSDHFRVKGFHHIELYCGDATNTYRRFQLGLGMNLVAKSDLSTGNSKFASYCLRSYDLQLVFTAPYSMAGVGDAAAEEAAVAEAKDTNPGFDAGHATDFFKKHGVAVRAIGLEVEDAAQAYQECIKHGGQAALAPVRLPASSSSGQKGHAVVSEVRAYGDVVLRFISKHEGFDGAFLPAYQDQDLAARTPLDYGLQRIDHAVGNVWDLLESVGYVGKMTGFHPFAEFDADDVGTATSGLNSIVLANNAEDVLIPLNEPVYGTPRKSQIQTYLECNNGPGLQHLALKTNDIFGTMRQMRAASDMGGFEFMERPAPTYYRDLPARLGDALTADQYRQIEELGLLADKDDQGVLLQIFTKPVGDRPTLFLEIIQRIGCQEPDPERPGEVKQRGGCGGFGKGNFKALFEAIEKYEAQLKI